MLQHAPPITLGAETNGVVGHRVYLLTEWTKQRNTNPRLPRPNPSRADVPEAVRLVYGIASFGRWVITKEHCKNGGRGEGI